MQPLNSIQGVSCCVPPGLHLNGWHAAMKFHPACELPCASWAQFEWLTCSHQIPSRPWVAMCLLGSIWMADMQPWNLIQWVSCCVPPGPNLNGWHAAMKFHPACELPCAPWAQFEWLTCSYEISSSLWVALCLLGSIWMADMQLWNPIQVVSCCVSLGLNLNGWHAAMKFHPACELPCASWNQFEWLTCSHEIPSSGWVAVCLLGSIWMADMQPWNSIQAVSCCVPPGLNLNCWHTAMKFHLGSELLCASWAQFRWLTCSHEISSRLWVAVCLLGSIWMADMQPWNLIQAVSCCVPLGLHLDGWHAATKSHPGCELLCASWAKFEWLTCSYEIPSRLWVAICLLDWIWVADMQPWDPIQAVSCCVPLGLNLNGWHAAVKSHPACELPYACWAGFEWLIYSHEIPSRLWVAVCLLGSIWVADMQPWNTIQAVSCCVPPGLKLNGWHAAMKSPPGCELLCASWTQFEWLTCSHEIPSSWWVAVCLPSIWIADMHEILSREWVAVPFRLHLNCWHAAMKYHPASELLYSSWAPFQSLTCCHHITSSLYLFSPIYFLLYLLTGCILQVDDVQGLVKKQFNVRLYAILFSCLHWYISNYIGTFFAFFHWSA